MTLEPLVIAQYLGEPTELTCHVSGVSRLHGNKLGVSWFFTTTAPADANVTSQHIAALDENGTLTAGEKYRSRFDSGLIIATRTETAAFKLRLLRTTNQDAGKYVCVVTAWTLGHGSMWKKSAEYPAGALNVNAVQGHC